MRVIFSVYSHVDIFVLAHRIFASVCFTIAKKCHAKSSQGSVEGTMICMVRSLEWQQQHRPLIPGSMTTDKCRWSQRDIVTDATILDDLIRESAERYWLSLFLVRGTRWSLRIHWWHIWAGLLRLCAVEHYRRYPWQCNSHIFAY